MRVSAFVAMVFLCPAAVLTQPVEIVKLADTETLFPGTELLFSSFADCSVHDAGVVFRGGVFASTGFYLARPGWPLVTLVETGFPIPGTGDSFITMGPARASGDNFVFRGSGEHAIGVFAWIRGELVTIALVGDEVAGLPGVHFTMFDGYPAIDGEAVVFVAVDTRGTRGLYRKLGSALERIADTTMPTVSHIQGYPDARGGRVSFVGLEAFWSPVVFLWDPQVGLQVAADVRTPVPGGRGNFVRFGNYAPLGPAGLSFQAESHFESGIYRSVDGHVLRVVDSHATVPAGGAFAAFGDPIEGDGLLYFSATTSEWVRGIYAADPLATATVVDSHTPLDFDFFTPQPGGWSSARGDQVCFIVTRDSRPWAAGLYLATVALSAPTRRPDPPIDPWLQVPELTGARF